MAPAACRLHCANHCFAYAIMKCIEWGFEFDIYAVARYTFRINFVGIIRLI